MYNQRQMGVQSGSVFDAAVASVDLRFKKNRVPRVGECVEMSDGRSFVLCSTNADLVAGEMVAVQTCQATELANLVVVTGDHDGSAGSSTVEINTTGVAMFGGAAGVIAANRLAGGFLHLVDGTGEGYTYAIEKNTAGTASANIILTLRNPLKVAVDATTDLLLVGSKYRDVVEGAVALSPIGCAVVPTTASTDSEEQYFWVQFKGPATVLGSCTVGVEVASAASGQVADSAEAGSGAYDRIVGTGLATTADGHAVVDLKINL